MEYTLITGACGGLGGAFVEEIASRGEALYLTGRSEERLSALAARLREKYPACTVLFAPCDLADSEARQAFFTLCDEQGATFSRLIYVAGVDTQMGFSEYSEQSLVMQMRVNFEGAVSFLHGVLARARLDGKTELLAVGSMSACTPMPYFALYSATKKGLETFLGGLRTELKGKAKVTCVLPGGIPTREDIKENIQSHGFWGRISAKSPRAVARISLKAVKKNKRKRIVGFWNHVIWFFTAIVPMPIKLRFIARRWSKTKKTYYI